MNAKEIMLENLAMTKIDDECMARYNMGRDNYGVFDPKTDTRDLNKEFEDEMLDAINYLKMILIQYRARGKKGAKGAI